MEPQGPISLLKKFEWQIEKKEYEAIHLHPLISIFVSVTDSLVNIATLYQTRLFTFLKKGARKESAVTVNVYRNSTQPPNLAACYV